MVLLSVTGIPIIHTRAVIALYFPILALLYIVFYLVALQWVLVLSMDRCWKVFYNEMDDSPLIFD